LPAHLHERLSLIRNAKFRLEERGITPTIDVSQPNVPKQSLQRIKFKKHSRYCCLNCFLLLQKIAKHLNMSQKKVRNATEVTNH